MVTSEIHTVYRWHCQELGCRTYFENEDIERLKQSIVAHEVFHKVNKEFLANQEREGMD